jgi:pre-mRNA-processing factor 6
LDDLPLTFLCYAFCSASGFTTRSDIGPAREGPSAEQIAAAREKRGEDGEDDEQFQDPETETGLFAGMVYEQDDEEADKIYSIVDSKMEERRKARKEAREREEAERYARENPKIQERFADLKRGLTAVTDSEWERSVETVCSIYGPTRKS